jgi:hypothetical protein
MTGSLNHAMLDQSRDPVGVDIAGEAQIIERARGTVLDDRRHDCWVTLSRS